MHQTLQVKDNFFDLKRVIISVVVLYVLGIHLSVNITGFKILNASFSYPVTSTNYSILIRNNMVEYYRGDYMKKEYLVTKSNYFIMNSSYDLSLEEQRIILTLASMVQPADEEFKPYKFRIADFMDLVGVQDKSKYTEIPKMTKELMKKVFEIRQGNKITQVAWLSSAEYENGTGTVELEFSPKLKPYMLQLKEKFTQYKLANILSMKSKYSPRIYEILKCNEFKKQGYIEIEVEELRKLLKADTVYPKYNDFKRYIIERTQKELKKISDISFDFGEVKTGRKVTSIKFIITSNVKSNIKPTQEVCTTKESKRLIDEEKRSTRLVSEIRAMFKEDITAVDVKKLLDASKGDIEIIKEKYAIAQTVSKIGNVVAWMLTAIKEDYKAPRSRAKQTTFSDYEQREYDYNDLERKLLGWD